MISSKIQLVVAILAYAAIVIRWFYVINMYHQKVLFNDTSFEYKDHPVFKSILIGRAVVLASVAPLIAFVKPSYFSTLLEGIKVAKCADQSVSKCAGCSKYRTCN